MALRRLKPEWLPKCVMVRVIVHWTAGAYKASDLDKRHYHFLIEDDGTVVKGDPSVKANARPKSASYAAHTLNCNTESIGVSVCCMAGAVQSPFSAGSQPMTQTQWNVMAEVVADLCETYGIAVTDKTVLAHGEVQKNLGIKQKGKWDPLVQPWAASKPAKQVMDEFRGLVTQAMGSEPEEALPKANIDFLGVKGSGVLADGSSFVPVKTVRSAGFDIAAKNTNVSIATRNGKSAEISRLRTMAGDYLEVRDFEAFGLKVAWDSTSKTVMVTG